MNSTFQNPLAFQVDGFIRVKGIEGAMAYPVGRNSRAPLFDEDEDILYVKSTDGAGFPTIRVFDLTERKVEQLETVTVSREEFNELKKMVEQLTEDGDKDAKQSVSRTKK